MAIPKFEDIFLPFLRTLSNQKVHTLKDVREKLARRFRLTPEEREEQVSSGSKRFDNRVAWTKAHLIKASLVDSPERGKLQITKRGLDLLAEKPKKLNVRILKERYFEYAEFRRKIRTSEEEMQTEVEETNTPEEVLETGYKQLRKALQQDLLDKIKDCSPYFFEKLVVNLLVAMGYGGAHEEKLGLSRDGGIDGMIKEDKLGLDVIYIQAKRWSNPVGRPELQAFAGSILGRSAQKGVFITTSRFTKDAVDYVKHLNQKIILVDGDQLTDYMIDFNVGVHETARYVVKKIDTDYFLDE
ncbi:restriction endonuclease [Shimazuella sp. AN120528]|uniref:restriction endonuclease n=1 Tax=Shimazuella soli TaxID=1892854 RepID=UPI001F0DB00B|nr:restriction endonuclease [Shimazuella soli]MCH5584087.1 restriction endonuclease [Shimazuella soli]